MKGVKVVEENVPIEVEPTRILMADQRSPVLFSNLNGMKAAGNLWSERERITEALGLPKDGLTQALMQALACPRPVEEVKKARFEEIVEERFDLRKLPIPKYYPQDGGQYVTAGVAIAEFDGKINVSFHRLMVIGKNRFAIRLVPRHLFTMHKLAMEKGEDLKVAFVVGTCPSVLLAGATSADYEFNELEMASALRFIGLKEGLKVRRTKYGIPVPADADYVLEGRLTSETHDEGPFVDITGTYDTVRKQPVFVVDRLYRRKDACSSWCCPGASSIIFSWVAARAGHLQDGAAGGSPGARRSIDGRELLLAARRRFNNQEQGGGRHERGHGRFHRASVNEAGHHRRQGRGHIRRQGGGMGGGHALPGLPRSAGGEQRRRIFARPEH
jgi:UbiD family decarboxylase